MQEVHWDEDISKGLVFMEHSVLQIPFFLMTLFGYLTPTLDQMYVYLPLHYIQR